jgi:hypothetical protein
MRDPLPNFLIIGAMRSGTTSLARYLDAHPEVFLAPQKEVHFFDRHYDEGLDWYRRQFSGASGQRAIGEATQSYIYDEPVPARMAATVPDARLVAILRNPVDRAYSHYWLNRAQGREPLEFAEALTEEPKRISGPNWGIRLGRSYLDRGRYLGQLRRVCDHYPRDSLLVVLFEDLRDDPAGTYECVCRFLKVDDSFRPSNLGDPINPAVEFRSMRLRDLSQRFPGRLGAAIGRVNVRKADYPKIDPALRKELLARFEDDNAELAAWLNRDLSVWSS